MLQGMYVRQAGSSSGSAVAAPTAVASNREGSSWTRQLPGLLSQQSGRRVGLSGLLGRRRRGRERAMTTSREP
jgi:hypothetical protein